MTRRQLATAQSSTRSRVALLYLVPFVVWPVSIAVYCHFERVLLESLSAPVHWMLILGVILGWGVLFMPVDYLVRRFRRKRGLCCPECGDIMVGTAGMIVMATGRCGRCGCRVIEDDAQPVVPPNAGMPLP
jgi:hypothetical protein